MGSLAALCCGRKFSEADMGHARKAMADMIYHAQSDPAMEKVVEAGTKALLGDSNDAKSNEVKEKPQRYPVHVGPYLIVMLVAGTSPVRNKRVEPPMERQQLHRQGSEYTQGELVNMSEDQRFVLLVGELFFETPVAKKVNSDEDETINRGENVGLIAIVALN
ncbi:hypothetical protein QAD02_008930 [Eretmocerus hayati]|uniref:Uncharacterized protein n=1 Tax=Eretmocerus hayati TaxID=131215 RepID=A0ACC2N844_9HYME|nr:hypothetical protein QAD02_008930 [Eretmocerus hayati]